MNYYNDSGTNQAAVYTFSPADVAQTVTNFIKDNPQRRLASMLDPLAITGAQEVFLVWLSFVDPEAKVQSPFAGQDMRIFRIPLPVDESIAGRTLMNGATVRETAWRRQRPPMRSGRTTIQSCYAFKDGYIVCFTPGGFSGVEMMFSDTAGLPQDKVFQLWVDAPILQLVGSDEE